MWILFERRHQQSNMILKRCRKASPLEPKPLDANLCVKSRLGTRVLERENITSSGPMQFIPLMLSACSVHGASIQNHVPSSSCVPMHLHFSDDPFNPY